MTTAFYTDRRTREAKTAVGWRRSATDADTELDSSRFQFGFRTLYLNLCYSRADRYLQRSATEELVTAIQETTAIYKQMSRGRMTRLVRWLQFGLRPQSSGVRDPTSMDTEPNGLRFYFRLKLFYLRLLYSRKNRSARRRLSDIQAAAIQGTMTTVGLSADKRPYEVGGAVWWERCVTSTGTELDGSKYSRENGYLQRTATIAIQRRSTMDYERMTATTVTATTTTTRLEADWWPCKAGTAVHWEQGAMSAGTGLNSPGFCFDSGMYYLHLSYSRDGRQLRRSATSIPAIKTQESMLERHRRSLRIRHPTNMEMEPDDSSFYFCFITFYLQVHFSRIDNKSGERTQQLTERRAKPRGVTRRTFGVTLRTCTQELLQKAARQWNSGSEQEARRARSIEATPVGPEGPSFMFRFQAFYLQLRRFREYRHLQGIEESTANYE